MTQLAVQQNPRVDYSALLLPFYRSDIWVWKEHPWYEQLTEKQKSYCCNLSVDFRKCTNRALREEIKYYGQCQIENHIVVLSTFQTHFVYLYQIFFYFMNAYHPEIDSMLDYDQAQFEKEFTEYWLSLGRSTTCPLRQVDGQMQIRVYDKYRSGTLGKILHIPRDIRENLGNPAQKFQFDNDLWDIRLTPFREKIPLYRPRYILAFDRISQQRIKVSAKHYIYHKLATKSFATCQDYLKGINLFSEYLRREHPEIGHLADLNRDIIEGFLRYAKATGRMTSFTSANRIGKVRDFLETCILLNLADKPPCQLIMDTDYLCRKKPMPRFFTDEELRQFNAHLDDLPLDIARMLFTIENVGMRISELCSLTIDCISKDAGGEYILTYYQFKCKKINRVPISQELAHCLERARAETIESFGEGCQYLFTRNGKKPISIEVFGRAMNELSYRHHFVDRAGKPLRVKSHTFRGTVATNYINIGIDPNVIRMMIGQADLRSLKFYIEASDESVLASTRSLLDQQDQLIRNIGNPSAIQNVIAEDVAEVQPLPNGSCTRKGKCEHFNACYACPMFHPDTAYIQVYRYQLQKAESALSMAQANGMERLADINSELVSNLLRIIKECESNEI